MVSGHSVKRSTAVRLTRYRFVCYYDCWLPGNYVYRVVASIPNWVTVTSLAIWQPVRGSHGRIPHMYTFSLEDGHTTETCSE
jgi:hypothetical protein